MASKNTIPAWLGQGALCGVVACALAVGTAWAQEAPPPQATEQSQAPGAMSGSTGQTAMQPGEPSQPGQEIDLQQAAQMLDKPLVDEQGETLATVDKIVRDQQSQELFAVVRSGGFMGMGGSQKVLPLSELQLQGEQVSSSTPLTKQQLEQMAAYDEQRFQEIPVEQRAETESGSPAEEQASMPAEQPEEQAAAEPMPAEEPQQQATAGSEQSGSQRPTY